MNIKRKTKLLVGLMLLITISSIGIISVNADTFIEMFDVSSDGTPVTSVTLEAGKTYKITAKEVFQYDDPSNFCADPMYYTSEYTDTWVWTSYEPCPEGHSFLQINGNDVNWGPFNNGERDPFSGHSYTIIYNGEGEPLTFQIIDWIDGDYSNNYCHFNVRIEETETPPPCELEQVLEISGKTVEGKCRDRHVYCDSALAFWSCAPGDIPSDDWVITLEYGGNAYAWEVSRVLANKRGTLYRLTASPYDGLDGYDVPSSKIRVTLRYRRGRIGALLVGRGLGFAGKTNQ